MSSILTLLALVAFIMAITYSIKTRKESDAKIKVNYRKGANVWGLVFIVAMVFQVLSRVVREAGGI